jgi:hypothetical protein
MRNHTDDGAVGHILWNDWSACLRVVLMQTLCRNFLRPDCRTTCRILQSNIIRDVPVRSSGRCIATSIPQTPGQYWNFNISFSFLSIASDVQHCVKGSIWISWKTQYPLRQDCGMALTCLNNWDCKWSCRTWSLVNSSGDLWNITPKWKVLYQIGTLHYREWSGSFSKIYLLQKSFEHIRDQILIFARPTKEQTDKSNVLMENRSWADTVASRDAFAWSAPLLLPLLSRSEKATEWPAPNGTASHAKMPFSVKLQFIFTQAITRSIKLKHSTV